MKIYDCFMFFDEEVLLDLRLNIMDRYVSKFIITEATYTHSGQPKNLTFDIKKFKKFANKIIYIPVDDPPPTLLTINENDDEKVKGEKLILNGYKRDNYQRQMLQKGLVNANPEDLIFISDIDEIPNLEEINLGEIKNKLIFFKQKMFYYKFNLFYESFPWYGTKACKNKHFLTPQWLRNIKYKKYPLWRLDIIFSKRKYNTIYLVENGGWHFTSVKSPEDIEKKLLNFAHHYDYEKSGIKSNELKKMIKEKKVFYDHNVDKKKNKWKGSSILKPLDLSEMPGYLSQNYKKYSDWLELDIRD